VNEPVKVSSELTDKEGSDPKMDEPLVVEVAKNLAKMQEAPGWVKKSDLEEQRSYLAGHVTNEPAKESGELTKKGSDTEMGKPSDRNLSSNPGSKRKRSKKEQKAGKNKATKKGKEKPEDKGTSESASMMLGAKNFVPEDEQKPKAKMIVKSAIEKQGQIVESSPTKRSARAAESFPFFPPQEFSDDSDKPYISPHDKMANELNPYPPVGGVASDESYQCREPAIVQLSRDLIISTWSELHQWFSKCLIWITMFDDTNAVTHLHSVTL
jgi:hypothetical protein